MSKYYAVVILPKEIDVTDDLKVKQAVSKAIEPFTLKGTSAENNRLDSYSYCEKKECEEWIPNYGDILENSSLFVFRAEALTPAGVPYVIVTPEPKWIQSKATVQHPEDPGWIPSAVDLCKSYHGHYAVLIHCARG